MGFVTDCLLEITKSTVPSGAERDFARKYLSVFSTDEFGNRFVSIGDSNTAFCAHTDDVSREPTDIAQVFDGRFLRTDGSSILGADDKCGVALLKYLIEQKKPGRYIFFAQEETGHHGSLHFRKNSMQWLGGVNKIVAFDRKGYSSIVTRQGSITASAEFATALCNRIVSNGLYMISDDTGISSDTVSFMDCIPECVNLSVGYFRAHSPLEFCDTVFLEHLARTVLDTDFETLPIARTPAKRLGT